MHEGHGEHHHIEHDAKQNQNMTGKETAMLKYTLEHNRHHAHDIDELAAKLNAAGYPDAADSVSLAASLFKEGNKHLEDAIAKIEKTEV